MQMFEIFKLIRLRTIAFTAFTMYAMRFFVVQPVLENAGFTLQMPGGDFSLLVIAVCCLVSAAYVINDYFDTKTDRISGNKSIVVGKTISRRSAITLHSILNVVAVGIAYYLARECHHGEIVFLFLLISLVLWFYSSRIKKHLLWGNLVVALLTGLIPLSVITFELPLLSDVYSEVVLKTHVGFAHVFYLTLCFSYFLFINMLIYEINKDMYSINGDRADGIMTLPVKFGIPATRHIIVGLIGIAIVSIIVFLLVAFVCTPVIWIYFIVIVIIPYLIYGYSILKNDRMKFQLRLIRLIMVLCVGVSVFCKLCE